MMRKWSEDVSETRQKIFLIQEGEKKTRDDVLVCVGLYRKWPNQMMYIFMVFYQRSQKISSKPLNLKAYLFEYPPKLLLFVHSGWIYNIRPILSQCPLPLHIMNALWYMNITPKILQKEQWQVHHFFLNHSFIVIVWPVRYVS